MIRFLKTGRSVEQTVEADRMVRQTVEGILADVAARGDAAVRADGGEHKRTIISQAETDSAVAAWPPRVKSRVASAHPTRKAAGWWVRGSRRPGANGP